MSDRIDRAHFAWGRGALKRMLRRRKPTESMELGRGSGLDARDLRRAMTDPILAQPLRRLAHSHGYRRPWHRLSDGQVLRLQGASAEHGLLSEDPQALPIGADGLIVQDTPEATSEPVRPAASPPAASGDEPTQTHWIRFRVVDDATNAPLPNIRLRIKAPGRDSQEYTTDREGAVYLEGLSKGSCDLEGIADDKALEVVKIE